ncbi:MAG TPA: hypothetical protein VGR49_00775 [Actinomycetota bacterium]|nr:hypothetical protein [Actinomycetota bacterium]
MNHILDDNTAEWDARVQREQQRKKRLARRAHIGMSAGVLLGLVALALGFTLQPKQLPAVAAPTPTSVKAVDPAHLGIPLAVSFARHKPESDVLERQAQSLAVGLARIWRGGKSEEAARTAHSYTVEYERVVGCDLRWIAGRAGPGVWEGTLSLVDSLREITPYVGRAREGQAVVVTAVICPDEGGAPQLRPARGEQRPSPRSA